ncbi:hypothetical protein MRB53_034549 [Persea americana]|uniref:Uncharacterized protein n=1 Tax=Persea americana TaxID=3435 RepID=A0ACC2K239_PERAE|nr:hypothetical protein MRB53_034549 [Persea americana]
MLPLTTSPTHEIQSQIVQVGTTASQLPHSASQLPPPALPTSTDQMVTRSKSGIKVVVNGAAKEIGKAAIVAVTKARGMEVAGAVDSVLVGQDAGKVCAMDEALEIPIISDLTMSKAMSVVIDFTDSSTVYDNVKQVTSLVT